MSGIDGAPEDVCYIIPEFSSESRGHFHHYGPYFEAIARQAGLYVVVERGDPVLVPSGRFKGFFVQRWTLKGRFARSLELLFILLRIRLRGCRRFFVRISIPAALLTALVARLAGGRMYYWNSGQGTNILPDWFGGGRFLFARLREELKLIPLRGVIRAAHFLVTGPDSMVSYYVRNFSLPERKAVVLYNHVDAEGYRARCVEGDRAAIRKELGLASGGRVVLFLGRISPLKGGAHILPFARELFSYPGMEDVSLVCVGEQHLDGFGAQYEAFPWKDRLLLAGTVAGAHVWRYYFASDVFILPSESEGFPRVLLEAMACGRAFAAFDVGGVREIVGPEMANCVVLPRDVAALARRVKSLLESPEERKRLGEMASARAMSFDTEPMARMFVDRICKGK